MATGQTLRRAETWAVVVLSALCLQCGSTTTGPSAVPSAQLAPMAALSPGVTTPAVVLPPEVLVGAGDIGLCTGGGNPQATARLLDAIDGTVVALGDNAYMSGTAEDYRNCYDPTWGRHKSRTRPVPGNHEYETAGGAPYFDYFGMNAGPPGLGYYSFDLGNWHVIALNSNIAVGAGSAQGRWLRADLAASQAQCTIAYWHFPRFSSGRHGDQPQMRDFWSLLYDAGAEIVLSGHDHDYERFGLQDADGGADPVRGLRQFVVGTGGAVPTPFIDVRPNSEARITNTLGVLKLTLGAGRYSWELVPVPGSGSGDAGSATCH